MLKAIVELVYYVLALLAMQICLKCLLSVLIDFRIELLNFGISSHRSLFDIFYPLQLRVRLVVLNDDGLAFYCELINYCLLFDRCFAEIFVFCDFCCELSFDVCLSEINLVELRNQLRLLHGKCGKISLQF